MAEETKRDTLKVNVTLDEDRVIELIGDYAVGNLLEKVVHCIDCKWHYKDKWCLHFMYKTNNFDYCSFGEQKEQEDADNNTR